MVVTTKYSIGEEGTQEDQKQICVFSPCIYVCMHICVCHCGCVTVFSVVWSRIKNITPFYYANAADLFSGIKCETGLIISGIAVSITTVCLSTFIYCRRDLQAWEENKVVYEK